MGYCGLVDATIEGHAAYLNSWLQVLKNDRTAIFTAARHASAAFDFLLTREMPPLGPTSSPCEEVDRNPGGMTCELEPRLATW